MAFYMFWPSVLCLYNLLISFRGEPSTRERHRTRSAYWALLQLLWFFAGPIVGMFLSPGRSH